MGGGNRKPTSLETSETDPGDFSSRFTSATAGTQENIEQYDDVDDEEAGPLEEFQDEDGEDGLPDFEEFREGEASLPSEETEADESSADAGAGTTSAGAASGGVGSIDGLTTSSEPEPVDSSDSGLDQYDVDVPAEVEDADGAGDFGLALFSDRAVAKRHLYDQDYGKVRAANPEEDAENRLGGWPEFDEDNVLRRLSLEQAGGAAGVTKDYMEAAELSGEDAESYRAFITNYYHGDNNTYAPEMWQAHSEMAAYAFTDALGVRVPDHTWNEEEGYVAVAGVETPRRTSTKTTKAVSAEAAERVDRQEFVDIMATQILAGNRDVHGENIRIGEDGQVHCIDYDRAEKEYRDMDHLQQHCNKASMTARTLDRRRDSSFDVDEEDIAKRAQEIAVSLEASGETERVVETVAQYDEIFGDKTGRRFAEQIKSNIKVAANAARNE